MEKIYLFLDFDGVLHGEGEKSKGFFEHVPSFCAMLREHILNIQIVISSSWREDRSLSYLQSLFDEDIRPLIVGTTPRHENSYDIGAREEEVIAYCNENQISSEQWIAIDDMKRFFKSDCRQLFLINSITGLTEENLVQLSLLIDEKFQSLNKVGLNIKI